MTELTRRNAFQSIAGVGLLAAITPLAEMNAQDKVQDPSPKNERDCAMASGTTDDEADCWDLTAKLAGKLLNLPKLHPMENDVCPAL